MEDFDGATAFGDVVPEQFLAVAGSARERTLDDRPMRLPDKSVPEGTLPNRPGKRPGISADSVERPIRADGLAEDIADAFVRRLQAVNSPVIGSVAARERRRARSIEIVEDVLEALQGDPCAAPSRRDARRASSTEFHIDGVSPSDVAEAADLLFALAFSTLLEVFPDNAMGIAQALARRLWTDMFVAAQALAERPQPAVTLVEVVDRERISQFLTAREAVVFELLLENAPVKQISTRLQISPHTAKHHITNIGRKLAATGRVEVVRRAREMGLLVAVPAAVVGAVVTDAMTVLTNLV